MAIIDAQCTDEKLTYVAEQLVGEDTDGVEVFRGVCGGDPTPDDVSTALQGHADRCGICGVWQWHGECDEDGRRGARS